MRTPMCVTAIDIPSHGVQSGAANAHCTLGVITCCASVHIKKLDLHSATDSIGLASVKFFWWALKNYFISARVTFQPFKVIQGR